MALHLAIMKADWGLTELQTGIGTAAHATLGSEQVISSMRVLLVDTNSWVQNSECRALSVSEGCITHQDSCHSEQCCVLMVW